MKFRKIFLIMIVVCAALCSATCFASEETHRAAIEEMLSLTDTAKLTESFYNQLKGMMKNQYAQMNLSEADRPIFEKYNARLFALMKVEMAYDKMKNDFTDVYMRVFTEEEIKDINKFYRTEVGRKMIERMPALMQEMMAISQNNLKRLMPEIEKISEEMANEIAKNHASQH